MNKLFSISKEQKRHFASIYLLEYMINEPKAFALLLERNDADLEPLLEDMLIKDWIQIQNNERYTANEKGRNELKGFLKKYSEFLNIFDVYCAIDLEQGEFAFSSYFEFDDDEQWNRFLDDERWEDLRVAVASYKGINPVEIVFMSFIQEKRFGRDASGWQFDLLLGSVWDEILEICNYALQVNQLGYETEEGEVSGEAVLEDIIEQGTELMKELHEQEARFGDDFGSGTYRNSSPDFDPLVEPLGCDEWREEDFDDYRNPRSRSSRW